MRDESEFPPFWSNTYLHYHGMQKSAELQRYLPPIQTLYKDLIEFHTYFASFLLNSSHSCLFKMCDDTYFNLCKLSTYLYYVDLHDKAADTPNSDEILVKSILSNITSTQDAKSGSVFRTYSAVQYDSMFDTRS